MVSIIPFSQYVKERISILDLTELICLKSVYSVFVPSDSCGLQIRWNENTAGNASNTHSGQAFILYVIESAQVFLVLNRGTVCAAVRRQYTCSPRASTWVRRWHPPSRK